MEVRAIDFVQIGVADMGRALRFSRETLGRDVPFSQGGRAAWDWNELATPPVALALDRGGPAPGRVSLALAVDDVAAAVAELRAQGVPIVREPREQDVCSAAVIRAPDGNELILHRRKDGTAG